jgi:hypothetical protein
MPITVPPENATLSAGASPMRAAAVVRTLAFVATFMPAHPAAAEEAAPTMNAPAICQPRVGSPK